MELIKFLTQDRLSLSLSFSVNFGMFVAPASLLLLKPKLYTKRMTTTPVRRPCAAMYY